MGSGYSQPMTTKLVKYYRETTRQLTWLIGISYRIKDHAHSAKKKFSHKKPINGFATHPFGMKLSLSLRLSFPQTKGRGVPYINIRGDISRY